MQKVLLAIDGSKAAYHAASFLARLPHKNKLEITVASVLTPPYNPMATLQSSWIDTCYEQDRQQATKAIADISELFQGANVSIEHAIAKGHAGETICELAQSQGCDLIVIGAKGHSMVSRILLGSTSDYVATQASCSVLVVRPSEPVPNHPLRIALGYEETGPAQAALEEITEINWGPQPEFQLVTISYMYGVLETEAIERMRASVRNAAEQLRESGLTTYSHLVESEHLGEGLVKYVEDHDCDIMVIGETPRNRVGRVLMGSTSRYVLRHAPCSVWIARNRTLRGLHQGKSHKPAASS